MKISDYLFNAKNDYENQLNTIYKNEKYLRFLCGKLFRKIVKYFSGNGDITELQRYILNKTEVTETIKDGKVSNEGLPRDYVSEFEKYNNQSFNNISSYITSLFQNNKNDLEYHYKRMLIKEKNKYKGIFLKKCENKSM